MRVTPVLATQTPVLIYGKRGLRGLALGGVPLPLGRRQCYKERMHAKSPGPPSTTRSGSPKLSRISAGLLMYRYGSGQVECLLVHLGGPFWAKKDAGAWFLPKGEVEPGEGYLAAARREFQEETGLPPEGLGGPAGSFAPLGSVRQKSGKTIFAWAFEGDCDPATLKSNTFLIEWPPRSGKQREFPEVDRAAFFGLAQAREKIHAAELPFLDRLAEHLESARRASSKP